MRKNYSIVIFLALLNAAFSIAQENTQSDTSYVLYFLYYEGSDFSVDGNYRYKLEEVASIQWIRETFDIPPVEEEV